MNTERETIKQYLSQLTPPQLATLVAELRADWQLPEAAAVAPIPKPTPPRIVGYDVVLTGFGESRVAMVRALRTALGHDLRAARDLIATLPAVLDRTSTQSEAETLAAVLRDAGGEVEIGPIRES